MQHPPSTIRKKEPIPQVKLSEEGIPKAYQAYKNVFSETETHGLPNTARTTHAINLRNENEPPYGPIYKLFESELEVFRNYLAENMEKGWIRKSTFLAGAPILFVKKPDRSLRLCVDYRALNKFIIKNRHPLPLIDETIDRLTGIKVYIKLDLRDAYHRIRIKPGDEWKTAFRTRYGHYEYIVMFLVLTNALATFQAYINETLNGYLNVFCVAYIDDICIYSELLEEHEEHVRKVLNRLHKYGLYAKLSKCEFHKTEIQFLGFNMGIAGVSINQAKVQTILEWPVPQNFHDIQIFMNFANFYRRFIKNFSKITRLITDLFKRDGERAKS